MTATCVLASTGFEVVPEGTALEFFGGRSTPSDLGIVRQNLAILRAWLATEALTRACGAADDAGVAGATRHYACAVRLDKIFRNPIIEAVKTGGLEPRECTFDFNDDGGCRVTHAPSGSSFVVEGPFGRFTTTTVVGEGAPQQLDAYIWPTVPSGGHGT